MNSQVKTKAQATQTVGKKIGPISYPRIQDEITVVIPAEAVALREREAGEDSLKQDLLVDYLH